MLKGRGGTDFRPGFEWLDEQKIQPAVCLYFTDMECSSYPETEPPFPTTWVNWGVPRQTGIASLGASASTSTTDLIAENPGPAPKFRKRLTATTKPSANGSLNSSRPILVKTALLAKRRS